MPLPSAKALLGGRMTRKRTGNSLSLEWETSLNADLVNGTKMWKGNGNTTILLFSLNGLEILHHEIRGQVNTILIEHFKIIRFQESRPANKQHTYQSINQSNVHER